jgi:hypothetical protein
MEHSSFLEILVRSKDQHISGKKSFPLDDVKIRKCLDDFSESLVC